MRLQRALNQRDPMSRQSRHALPWAEAAGEIERICRRKNLRRLIRIINGGPKLGNHLGQRVLLAGHACHKAAAANFAARLQAAIRAHQFLPGRGGGLVGQQITEHNAVAPQQQPAPLLGPFLSRDCHGQAGTHQGPAASWAGT